jgi:hypothetical protein
MSTSGKMKMLPVWFWVGIVLIVYGLIIIGSGIYYIFNPSNTALSHLHPSLWWGGIMLVGGIIFLSIGKRG